MLHERIGPHIVIGGEHQAAQRVPQNEVYDLGATFMGSGLYSILRDLDGKWHDQASCLK
jgi:hypothetical protein